MRPRWLLVSGVLACVLACAGAAQAAVPERYELRSLTEEGATQGLADCTGQSVGAAEQFLAKTKSDPQPDRARQFSGEGGAGVALLARGRWACVRLSSARYPMWPVEALYGAITPVGAAPQAVAAWRRAMLDQLTQTGIARGLIVYPNGNANQFELSAEQGQALNIKYTSKFLKAESFSDEGFTAVLRDPGVKSIVSNSDTTGPAYSRMAIPLQRLAWPVQGEYAAIEPSAAAQAFAFEGTQWAEPGGKTRLWLQTGGLAIHSSGTRSDNGTWAVDNGVLQVAMAGGARFAMHLNDDRKSMQVRGRRTVPPTHDEGQGEWQWSVRMELQ